jgi:hypothetical protein
MKGVRHEEKITGREYKSKSKEGEARVFVRKQEHVSKIRPRVSIRIISMVAKDVNRNVPYPKVLNFKNIAFFKFDFWKRKKETR